MGEATVHTKDSCHQHQAWGSSAENPVILRPAAPASSP